jgi:elongation factor P
MEMNDLKRLGTVIKINNEPYIVIESQHSKSARSKACVRTKLKNLINGAVLERTFNASDKIEGADVGRSKANFLYKDGNEAHFMDSNSYEQFSISLEVIGGQINFLKEGLDVDVMLYENKPISIILPPKVNLKITETEPAVRGDTAQGSVTKKAKLETGATINVPIFIKQDEMVRVNTETGEYVERV